MGWFWGEIKATALSLRDGGMVGKSKGTQLKHRPNKSFDFYRHVDLAQT
jgi:hypothetical protein